jgi:hypothetical protein
VAVTRLFLLGRPGFTFLQAIPISALDRRLFPVKPPIAFRRGPPQFSIPAHSKSSLQAEAKAGLASNSMPHLRSDLEGPDLPNPPVVSVPPLLAANPRAVLVLLLRPLAALDNRRAEVLLLRILAGNHRAVVWVRQILARFFNLPAVASLPLLLTRNRRAVSVLEALHNRRAAVLVNPLLAGNHQAAVLPRPLLAGFLNRRVAVSLLRLLAGSHQAAVLTSPLLAGSHRVHPPSRCPALPVHPRTARPPSIGMFHLRLHR